jgi:hypothetical protein
MIFPEVSKKRLMAIFILKFTKSFVESVVALKQKKLIKQLIQNFHVVLWTVTQKLALATQ